VNVDQELRGQGQEFVQSNHHQIFV